MIAISELSSTLIGLIKQANPLSGEQVWKRQEREHKKKLRLNFKLN